MANESVKRIFSKNLRRLLEENGMQDKDLMPITGASQTAISDWLNAKKYPRIDKIERIANYFHIQKSDLIEEKSEDESPPRTIETRIVSAGMDDLPKEAREKILAVFLEAYSKLKK